MPPNTVRPDQPTPNQQYGGPMDYRSFGEHNRSQYDPGTAYEQGILGGKYLEPSAGLNRYVSDLGRQHNVLTSRGLGEISSPFGSGATMGFEGMNIASRAQYQGDQDRSFDTAAGKLFTDAYEGERNRMTQTNQDVSTRTIGMRNNLASAYGADQGYRSAKEQADAARQAARLNYMLGRDRLAQEWILEGERLDALAAGQNADTAIDAQGADTNTAARFGLSDQQWAQISPEIRAILEGVGQYGDWRGRNRENDAATGVG